MLTLSWAAATALRSLSRERHSEFRELLIQHHSVSVNLDGLWWGSGNRRTIVTLKDGRKEDTAKKDIYENGRTRRRPWNRVPFAFLPPYYRGARARSPAKIAERERNCGRSKRDARDSVWAFSRRRCPYFWMNPTLSFSHSISFPPFLFPLVVSESSRTAGFSSLPSQRIECLTWGAGAATPRHGNQRGRQSTPRLGPPDSRRCDSLCVKEVLWEEPFWNGIKRNSRNNIKTEAALNHSYQRAT